MEKIKYIGLTAIIVLLGILIGQPILIVVAEIVFAVLCVRYDVKKGIFSLTFISYYSFFAIFYCIGNFLVVYTIDTPEERYFNTYLVKEYIQTALLILLIAHYSIVFSFEYSLRRFREIFPEGFCKVYISEKTLYAISRIIIVVPFVYLFHILKHRNFLLLVTVIVFVVVQNAVDKKDRVTLVLSAITVMLISYYHLLNTYLRMNIVIPMVVFLFAYMRGKRGVYLFGDVLLYPFYFVIVAYIMMFDYLGELRMDYSSTDKLSMIFSRVGQEENELENVMLEYSKDNDNFFARYSNINQVSRVCDVAAQDGFYNGSTLEYMAFAFIPRFIWPDKPKIAQGEWFALKAGLAHQYIDGDINNSVNMTTAGELYLNFGFAGVVIGVMLIGVFLSFLWSLTGFDYSLNLLGGSVLGLYMLMLASTSLGIDMQFIVTAVSYFLIFIFLEFFLRFIKVSYV